MNIFGNSSDYAAKWSLSDFYEEDEVILKNAIASGENFKAEWGCKKEIHYASLEKNDNGICIEVRVYIDELEDLLDTAIWQAAGGNDVCSCGWHWLQMHHKGKEHEVFESLIKLIRQGDYYPECHTCTLVLLRDAIFEEVVDTINEAEDEAEKIAEQCYQEISILVKQWMEKLQ